MIVTSGGGGGGSKIFACVTASPCVVRTTAVSSSSFVGGYSSMLVKCLVKYLLLRINKILSARPITHPPPTISSIRRASAPRRADLSSNHDHMQWEYLAVMGRDSDCFFF